jgi:hypothetical protein
MKRPTVKTKRKVGEYFPSEEERYGFMIVKAEFKITVLLASDSVEKAAAMLASSDLIYIINEMNDGEWLGTHEFIGVTRVYRWDLASACAAVGGDVSFFGDEMDRD